MLLLEEIPLHCIIFRSVGKCFTSLFYVLRNCVCLFVIQRLSNRIKKLQESELTLDDMDSEDTNYVLEEKCVIKHACYMYFCYAVYAYFL